MDFALDSQQLALEASVREQLADRFAGAARAAYEDPDSDGHPDKLWDVITGHGWLAITVPEGDGGLGLGLVEAQLVARAFGALTLPGPWLPTMIAIEAIRLGGSDEQRERWLPGLISGDLVATHALDQQVQLDGDAVDGRLGRVEYAEVAQLLVMRTGQLGLAIADLRNPGVAVTRQRQYDLSTRIATVELDHAPAERLTDVPDLVARGTVLTAADLVGIAREAISRTVAYDKQRVQFGVPVGSFQALKHALADLHVAVTMAEHATLYAAHAIDAGRTDAPLATAVAKAKASAAAKQATAAMIQFHGGIGFTWEHDAHLYFKRARRLAAAFGDETEHRERVAALLMDDAP